MLRFQRSNVIETGTSSDDSDHKGFDTLKLMDSKNPFIRLMIYGKLKRMITSYVGTKVKEVDKNLVRGMFLRKIKDFDEDRRDDTENKTLLDRLKGTLIQPMVNYNIKN